MLVQILIKVEYTHYCQLCGNANMSGFVLFNGSCSTVKNLFWAMEAIQLINPLGQV